MDSCKSQQGVIPEESVKRFVVLDKTLERPMDSKEIKPVNPKGNQPWIFFGRTEAKAVQYFGHLMWRDNSGKDSDAGKDWRQKEKGAAEDEVVK